MSRKFVRIDTEHGGVLLETAVIKENTLDIEHPARCRCCNGVMSVAAEFIQWGFLEDKYTLLFACIPCGRAWWYSYTLSLIELAAGVDSNGNPGKE